MKIEKYFDVKSELFVQATTHASCSAINYERLEFLGDSILNFVVSEYLFQKKDYNEGNLSRARSNLVSKQHLSAVFDDLKVDKYVKTGKSLGALTANIKCDIVEALIAAYYLKNGVAKAKEFVVDILKIEEVDLLETDYKTMLQERLQKDGKSFEYKFKECFHKFQCQLFVEEKLFCTAEGHSKSECAQQCAKQALEII